MPADRQYLAVVRFVGLYLLLSVPPFLALNWRFVASAYADLFPPSPLEVLGLLAFVAVLLYAFTLADEGVSRYRQFLAVPSDALSVLVAVSFVWAAVSWWAVPELAVRTETVLTLNDLLLLIFGSQLPMLVFLTLLTAIGLARDE